MPPTWLTLIAWIWLGISFVSSGVILFDIFVRGHRQPMGVMDAVYPITALYLGPLALAFYWRWARSAARTTPGDSTNHPYWAMWTHLTRSENLRRWSPHQLNQSTH